MLWYSLIAIILIVFCVNNRQMLSIDFFPLPIILEARLFIVLFLSFIAGMLFDKYLQLHKMVSKLLQPHHKSEQN